MGFSGEHLSLPESLIFSYIRINSIIDKIVMMISAKKIILPIIFLC